MIANILLLINLLSPVVDHIYITPESSIVAQYNKDLNQMCFDIVDYSDLKVVVESDPLRCNEEKQALQEQYLKQIKAIRLENEKHVNNLTNQIKSNLKNISTLESQNANLQDNIVVLKWVAVGAVIVGGATSYAILK